MKLVVFVFIKGSKEDVKNGYYFLMLENLLASTLSLTTKALMVKAHL